MQTRTCRTCETLIERPIANQQYCSPDCKPTPAHAASPRTCLHCRKPFASRDGHGGRTYCSDDCRDYHCGNRPKHELDPDFDYRNENNWRKQIVRLFGGKCSDCGATGKLQAHYIVPRSRGGVNTIRNGVLLCEPCHQARHFPVDGDLVERIARRVVQLLHEEPI